MTRVYDAILLKCETFTLHIRDSFTGMAERPSTPPPAPASATGRLLASPLTPEQVRQTVSSFIALGASGLTVPRKSIASKQKRFVTKTMGHLASKSYLASRKRAVMSLQARNGPFRQQQRASLPHPAMLEVLSLPCKRRSPGRLMRSSRRRISPNSSSTTSAK